ncbi:MAG: glutamyl-tRNA reductase [Polyangiaceae bacterium]|nr:glutamyl-tRNA reductase [Polyangiaceae bacterium]
MIAIVGISHRTAPVEVRERVAVAKDSLPEALARMVASPSVGEVVCLSTCNRVELIAAPRADAPLTRVADELAAALEELAGAGGLGGALAPHLARHVGDEGVRHLFRVASSLDSIVVGEPQILGQLKDALEAAEAAGTVGPILSRAVQKALMTAKRVRTETAIGRGLVSVSSAAVDLAAQIFGDLAGKTTLLVGAGEMAEAAAEILVKQGGALLVTNRRPERAAELAARYGGATHPFEDLEGALARADVVLSSTSARGFVIDRELVRRALRRRRGGALFLIDIAVPRDIDPEVNGLDGVFRYDIDDLEAIVAEGLGARRDEAARAAQICDEDAKKLGAWMEARGVVPTLVALRARTKQVVEAELERSLSGKLKHLGEPERAALHAMVEAAVNKLVHSPTVLLRRHASEPRGEQLAQAVRELYELPDVAVIEEARASKKGG